MNNTITEIYQVFKDYFGEDKVDLQTGDLRGTYYHAAYSIIVHWDSVTITNEMDRSIVIYHLYSLIPIRRDGTIESNPSFLRSEYNELQWKAGYMHSHLPSFGDLETAITWRISCLGTGPINRTIERLRFEGTADTNVWLLFCVELDKYVTVESLTGGPYMRMEDVEGYARTSNSSIPLVIPFTNYSPLIFAYNSVSRSYLKGSSLLNYFVPYLLANYTFPIQYYEGSYHLGATDSQIILDISNLFIQWYNLPENSEYRSNFSKSSFFYYNILTRVVAKNGQLYSISTSGRSRPELSDVIGTHIFTFKGQPVTLTAIGAINNSVTESPFMILNPGIIGYIIYQILRFIDCTYGKDNLTADKEIRII